MSQEGEKCDDDQLEAEESEMSWGDIWSESVYHNRNVKWLNNLQREVNITKQEKVDITKEVTRSRLSQGALVKEFQSFAWESKITT